jgi:hypothetical protein
VSPLTELRAAIVLTGLLIVPGWAALSLSDQWRRWKALQRWIVAIGLSIASYPVVFYALQSLSPFLTLGPYEMGTLLLGLAAVTAWRMRKHWKEQFALDRLEWIAVAVLGMTLVTRFWIIRDQPYPAWSDSLHHAILTRLTAVQGKLPATLSPYFPIPLDQYHLGLYALTATTQWLAQVPPHTALLWTSQALNALCGLGVYLVLDRKVGRVGAVVGAVVVGLLSHQPAWYVNWGRFTQLSSQTILLIAWLVAWEAIKTWKLSWQKHRPKIVWSTAFAGALTGAVFLLHFRVAVFYLPLLAMSVVWELRRARERGAAKGVVLGVALIGVTALIIITPALWKALRVYTSARLEYAGMEGTTFSPEEISTTVERFYEFGWRSVPILAARPWLIWTAAVGAAAGLLRRNKLVIASVLWIIVLYLFGNSYTLGVPFLSFTNLGAVLIMLYLPIGLIIGSVVEEGLTLCGPRWRGRMTGMAMALTLVAGLVASRARATEIEPYRYFVTPADVEAMQWIRENTPEDALFAVNTHFWLPKAPHGTDAGYWIPYFTGRQSTAGSMLSFLGSAEHQNSVIELSRMVEELETDNEALTGLQARGVDYVYVGRVGDFSGAGLRTDELQQSPVVDVVYREDGVTIFQIASREDRPLEGQEG